MKELRFNNIEELIRQAIKDNACSGGIEWAKRHDNLDTLIKECPSKYRYWALCRGYTQFAQYCDWNELDAWDWHHLLSKYPQFSVFRRK